MIQVATSLAPRTDRLEPIEGLRAYLALWVLLDHTLEICGYQPATTPSVLRLLRGTGGYAVKVFVIVSGFVIFSLLDRRRERPLTFVLRRFFRLYPLAILLFLVSIPLSKLSLWNIAHASAFLTVDQAQFLRSPIEAWWTHLGWNVGLHATLLHGLVPERFLPGTVEAFLPPAWSVSLEWQFYLAAPLVYALVTARSNRKLLAVCLLCVVCAAGRHFAPYVTNGAALPYHVEFFFAGATSYFVYNRIGARAPSGTTLVAVCLAIFLFSTTGLNTSVVPVCIWIVILGVLCERSNEPTNKLARTVLTHRRVVFLGEISYGIYLSHYCILIVVQAVLLRMAPGLSRITHCASLLVGTLGLTLPVAIFLHYRVERPFIALGRSLAANSARRRAPAARRELVVGDTRSPETSDSSSTTGDHAIEHR
jgi:peptidoglycan/LPS O-acetylase OafA/YrhL